jgi:tetratricopeptide (TPR) repeat protein
MASKTKDEIAEPIAQVLPKTAQDFLHRGWARRVTHEHVEAENDFRQALKLAPGDEHATYGLAQALMEQGKKDEAVKTFKEAIKLLDGGALEDDPVRASMLRRQALGHIERMNTGEWDLINIGNAIPKGK